MNNLFFSSYLDLIVFVLSTLIFFSVITLSFRYKYHQERFERIRSIATGTKRLIKPIVTEKKHQKKRAEVDFKKVVIGFFRDYLVKLTEDQATDFRTLFERAGWSPVNAVAVYSTVKIFSVFLFGFLAHIMIETVPYFSALTPLLQFCVYGAAILLGAQLFTIIIKIRIYEREELIKRDLSSALDLLAICTTAGLSIDRSLEYVAEELGSSNPELCRELAITAIELNILPDRRSAFRNLPNRINLPLVRAMATTLVQSEEQGTSISSTLKVLSAEFREQKMLAIETRAAKLPAILTVPIILFTLPSLMIMIMGPTIIKLLHEVSF